MLATHKPFEEELEAEAVVKQTAKGRKKETQWIESPTALGKMRVSSYNQSSAKPTKLGYQEACEALRLPLKQYQVFELKDKQRLEQLYEKFEQWIVDSKIDLKHLVPSVLFWQQFEFAVINPANANLDATEKGKYTFQDFKLHEPKNIMYIKGYNLESLLFSDAELNVNTGNDARFQFHLLTVTLHPIVSEFLESI
jgi:hypothetical protein